MPRRAAAPGPASQGGRRASRALLLIEPDAPIAHLCALVLGEGGYAIACAASPDEALALLTARGPGTFGAVLSDNFARSRAVPYAWLDHLRTRTDAPIVICTRDPAAPYADHRARGYAGVLAEPCDLQDLLDAVAHLRASTVTDGEEEPLGTGCLGARR